ncbi:hypothetical protein LTR56_025053 [Elasticomyces elasticus]|nr:hypothetical protein LTR56_025053 [Elasticomyces elasticus]KAK3645016.1 hypothetical protein LTR22_014935 [Elasticomyces elasticus]KAK4905011.1 hypothetical protein LTR49_025632 [Elasticomyces elasticus]
MPYFRLRRSTPTSGEEAVFTFPDCQFATRWGIGFCTLDGIRTAEMITTRVSLGDGTQKRVDKAVAIYPTAIKPEWPYSPGNDQSLFPSHYRRLLLNTCASFKASCLDSKPQMSIHYYGREHVSRKTMDHRRQILGYGISDVFRLRREDVSYPDRLYHETRLFINKLYEDSGESGASGYEKKYLGIDDLKLVIHAEIALHGERSKDFAYSLTMVTAARPGALYATTFKENGQTKIRWPGLECGDAIFTFCADGRLESGIYF